MANRRLAPAAEQPAAFAFSSENAEWAKGQIEKYPEGRQASAVIPLLWKAQEQNGGWLPQKAIEAVADELGMPHIRVLEVATFYTMFALEPVGKFWIQLCGTVPCDSCGARELKDYLHHRLGARVLQHVANVGAVDLQHGQGQRTQAGQRRMAGAEVIHRDAAAQAAQLPHQFFGCGLVLADFALAELEAQ